MNALQMGVRDLHAIHSGRKVLPDVVTEASLPPAFPRPAPCVPAAISKPERFLFVFSCHIIQICDTQSSTTCILVVTLVWEVEGCGKWFF